MRLRGGTITEVHFETSLLHHHTISKFLHHPTPDTNPYPSGGRTWREFLLLLFFPWFSLPLQFPRFYYKTKRSARGTCRDVLSSIKNFMETQVYVTHLQSFLRSLCNNFDGNLAALALLVFNLEPFKLQSLPTTEVNTPDHHNPSKGWGKVN